MLIAELIGRGWAGRLNDPRGTGCRLRAAQDGNIRRSERVRHPLRERLSLATYRSHALIFEAKIRHMHLDSEGNVTVSIGHLLRNADTAAPF